MKLCITSIGKEKDALADQRFGRCPYFVIFDTEENTYKAVENNGVVSPQGAGIAAAQQIIDEKVDAVITGHMGPNAMQLINGAAIKIYQGKGVTIEEEIQLFHEGALMAIDQPVPAHSGMGNGQKRG
ncbi:NifB/NifX family molybdenum-iron cluster-binding protein [Clostridiaceae bacterium 35-E11]